MCLESFLLKNCRSIFWRWKKKTRRKESSKRDTDDGGENSKDKRQTSKAKPEIRA